MANYSYQSSSYSSGGGGGGLADAAFNTADANRDGRVDLGEFRQFVGQNLGAGAGYGASSSSFESAAYGGGLGLGGGSYESSAFEASGGGIGGLAGGYEAALAGGGASSLEQVSYASGGGLAGGESAIVVGGGLAGASGYEAQATQIQQYATDAQGLFQDPNPQIIRRPAAAGVQTYTQNIRVRFLQPPPVPPHGPLIIQEVRPPQPPPPPPLRIRQQAPPLPTPPPLILRERPPQPPVPLAQQTVIRRLAALPVPPRSVIIERLPPLPPRPRDIIIERWVPYGSLAKRRTIVQRAGPAVQYPRPRNVIIQYEPVQVRIVRQFQRLGVVQANPAAYVQTYGAALLDAGTLVQQARAAGVVEDISPPLLAAAAGFGAAAYGQQVGLVSGLEGGAGGLLVEGAEAAGLGGGFSSSSYESSSFSSGGGGGLQAGLIAGGLGGGLGGGLAYESASYSSGLGGADAAFASADLNRDGGIDQSEFRQFIGQNVGGLQYE